MAGLPVEQTLLMAPKSPIVIALKLNIESGRSMTRPRLIAQNQCHVSLRSQSNKPSPGHEDLRFRAVWPHMLVSMRVAKKTGPRTPHEEFSEEVLSLAVQSSSNS